MRYWVHDMRAERRWIVVAAAVTPLLVAIVWQLGSADEAPSVGITTQADAAGGVDGVIDGAFGFHTAHQGQPWWQVDLEHVREVSLVRIWNRADGATAHRAWPLTLLVSTDGEHWRRVYHHDGTPFYGRREDRMEPLKVTLDAEPARYVRVQLPGRGVLHLDEVQVFAKPPLENLAIHRPADQSSVSRWSRPAPPEPHRR